MRELQYCGSTATFYSLGEGTVVKQPSKVWSGNANYEALEEEHKKALEIERQLFEFLGHHDMIVPYRGPYAESGIQLAEANHGNLQDYIDTHNKQIGLAIRWKWVLQATKAVVLLHQKGVIHSDLRLDNYLVHSPGLDLWICDFGGSFCEKLGLDGRHLPDDPFFDPRLPYESSPATDIFSLGSIFYTILTGHWPHLNGSTPVGMAKFEFQEKANKLFKEGKFPNLSGISGGEVIDGCWNHKYATAAEVLAAMEKAIKSQGFEM